MPTSFPCVNGSSKCHCQGFCAHLHCCCSRVPSTPSYQVFCVYPILFPSNFGPSFSSSSAEVAYKPYIYLLTDLSVCSYDNFSRVIDRDEIKVLVCECYHPVASSTNAMVSKLLLFPHFSLFVFLVFSRISGVLSPSNNRKSLKFLLLIRWSI